MTTIEKELFQLIQNGQCDAIQQFFKQHVPSPLFNINCVEEKGFTLLMAAVCSNIEDYMKFVWEDKEHPAMEIIMILLENGSDINMKGSSPYCM